MIFQSRASRRTTQVVRSQLAVRLGIAVYAVALSLIAIRVVILVVDFPQSVWTVKTLLALSMPIVRPLQIVPAAQRPLLGAATLSDLTACLLLVSLPLLFLGRRAWS